MRPELDKVVSQIEKAVSGKRDVIEKLALSLIAGGHVLLDDVPGVGKTTLAVALGRAVGLTFRRVQCTPDLMPGDLVGFTMYDRAAGDFIYRSGALLGVNLVLADEINRASSKTQSAMLEAMEERQATVDGETHRLEKPFMVVATQNSVGAAGTQMLPYAQMDRFLMRLSLGYPDYEAQMALLRARQEGDPMDGVENVISREGILAMQAEARRVTSRDEILDYITRLAMASREHPLVEVGISPRGALFVDRAAKARAWMEGRDYVTGEDVARVLMDVCGHRILVKEGAEGRTARDVIDELIRTVESPDRHQRPKWLRGR